MQVEDLSPGAGSETSELGALETLGSASLDPTMVRLVKKFLESEMAGRFPDAPESDLTA